MKVRLLWIVLTMEREPEAAPVQPKTSLPAPRPSFVEEYVDVLARCLLGVAILVVVLAGVAGILYALGWAR